MTTNRRRRSLAALPLLSASTGPSTKAEWSVVFVNTSGAPLNDGRRPPSQTRTEHHRKYRKQHHNPPSYPSRGLTGSFSPHAERRRLHENGSRSSSKSLRADSSFGDTLSRRMKRRSTPDASPIVSRKLSEFVVRDGARTGERVTASRCHLSDATAKRRNYLSGSLFKRADIPPSISAIIPPNNPLAKASAPNSGFRNAFQNSRA